MLEKICRKCHGSGVKQNEHGKYFCGCKAAKKLKEDISKGKPCPVCENRGIHRKFDLNGRKGIFCFHCECIHGKSPNLPILYSK